MNKYYFGNVDGEVRLIVASSEDLAMQCFQQNFGRWDMMCTEEAWLKEDIADFVRDLVEAHPIAAEDLYCDVVFASSEKPYSYKTLFADLKPRDMLVAMTSRGPAVVLFSRYTDQNPMATQYILAKVDLQPHTDLLAKKIGKN